MSDNSPKITWDDDPLASLAASTPRRQLGLEDQAFIEQTLRMIAENGSYKGFLVMHDQETNRMRYIVMNNGTLFEGMASLGLVFSRLAELAADAASQ